MNLKEHYLAPIRIELPSWAFCLCLGALTIGVLRLQSPYATATLLALLSVPACGWAAYRVVRTILPSVVRQVPCDDIECGDACESCDGDGVIEILAGGNS